MTFLQFFGYYIASNLILQFAFRGFYYFRRKYIETQIKNAIQNGQIQIVGMDELNDQLLKDKKTWN